MNDRVSSTASHGHSCFAAWDLHLARNPLWIAYALAIVALPTVTGLAQVGSTEIDAPITLFELGFEYLTLLFPLLAVGLHVFAFSSEIADRWIVYVRPRADIRRYLLARLGAGALLSFGVPALAVGLWGLVAFGIAPHLGLAPNGYGQPLSPDELIRLTTRAATFSQLAHAGTAVYVLVYAAWVGLWGAVFSAVAFLVLLVADNRLLAFTTPLVLYWLDNLVLSNLGLEQLRTGTAVFPFAITQQPIALAAIPVLFWLLLIAVLGGALTRRRFEVAALL
ncbi:MAG: hypothetical protein QM635_02060 [Microbacteriaceae bacterium]